jgi:hypothetical protein
MTTGRITTALGAVALGLATAAAVPALAQTNTGGTNQPSATTTTPPATPAAPSTGTSTATGSTASKSKMAMPMGTTTHANKQAATHPMTRTHVATRGTHHMMHHAMGANESGPNAQDAAIDQLNQQSLQAAQQGKTFSPSSGKL